MSKPLNPDGGEARSLSFRLTNDELDRLWTLAENAGVSKGEFLRSLLAAPCADTLSEELSLSREARRHKSKYGVEPDSDEWLPPALRRL